MRGAAYDGRYIDRYCCIWLCGLCNISRFEEKQEGSLRLLLFAEIMHDRLREYSFVIR